MGFSIFPTPTAVSGDPASQTFAAGSSGTYTLSTPLAAGLYEITTDTSQSSFTLSFKTSGGHIFPGTVRGGKGFVSVPVAVTQIIVPSLTFPVNLNIRLAAFTQIAAPTSSSFAFTVGNDSTYTFTSPSGATDIVAYFSNGTNTAFGTTTSPKTAITTPGAAGTTQTVVLVAKDATGVIGLGTTITSSNTVFIPFTGGTVHTYTESGTLYFANYFGGSGTLTVNNTTTTDFVLIGGGSGGGGNYVGARGGAGGGVIAQSGLSLAAGTYSIGIGGGANPTGGGGNSTFNGMTALGMNGKNHSQSNSGTATGSGTWNSSDTGASGAGAAGSGSNGGNGRNSLGGWSFPASIVGSSGYVGGGGPGYPGTMGNFGLGSIGQGGNLYAASNGGGFLIRTAVV